MSGSTYRNYLDGREICFQEFYSRIRGGENAVTSAVSVGDFETAMRAVLDRGEDLLCICFSSALSATYQSAAIAADSLREAYPDRTLYVVDSLCASMGQGLLVWLCAQEKRNGKSIREVRDFAEQQKGSVCHWFTVDDLYHLNLSQDSGLESPEGSYGASEITSAINAFPEEYRVPFSMHVAGYKYNEIAEKMNLPLGTVKSRIFFARKKLQAQFADYR